MGLFLSTYVNKVDKKGRVSIPAPFRTTLAKGQENGQIDLMVFPSPQRLRALDACTPAYLEQLSAALDDPTMSPKLRNWLETKVYGKAAQLTLDPEGRVVIPEALLSQVGITENVSFIGRRKSFQLWDPAELTAYEQQMDEDMPDEDMSLSGIMTRVNRPAGVA